MQTWPHLSLLDVPATTSIWHTVSPDAAPFASVEMDLPAHRTLGSTPLCGWTLMGRSPQLLGQGRVLLREDSHGAAPLCRRRRAVRTRSVLSAHIVRPQHRYLRWSQSSRRRSLLLGAREFVTGSRRCAPRWWPQAARHGTDPWIECYARCLPASRPRVTAHRWNHDSCPCPRQDEGDAEATVQFGSGLSANTWDAASRLGRCPRHQTRCHRDPA